MPVYRRNVALILARPSGEVLLCERSDYRDSWQFPQGGAKDGESDLEALQREVLEEISLPPDAYHIVCSKGPYFYEFRSGFKKEGCDGQSQTYFLAQINGALDPDIRVDRKEFQRWRWLPPASFRIEWVAPIKRDVYRAVFRDFFGVNLDAD